jgi:hypothetical protein
MDNGAKRACKVWHRRAGKDRTDWNFTIRAAYNRPGGYYYMLPKYTQARKIIWDGIDANSGLKFIDHIPKEILLKKPNDTEMKITIGTRCGKESIIQLVGSDRYNDLVGTPPAGLVLSEWSISNPASWGFFRPILKENDGWALFNFTPRGKNHGYETYQMAKKLMEAGDPRWFCQLLTVDDTGVLTPEDIEAERREGMDEDMIQQEYYCSFSGAMTGSYYGKLMEDARKEGRIRQIPIDPTIPVDTYWDLGMDDYTAIWFVQVVGKERRAVHYLQDSDKGLPHYAVELNKIAHDRKFVFGQHFGPHDIRVRELGTGVSRLETAKKLGIKFNVTPQAPLTDGIDACRNVIPTTWFDEEHCKEGIRALENYAKKWDEINRTYRNTPNHDWASHGADGFRTFAMNAHKADLKREILRRRTGNEVRTKAKEYDIYETLED